MSRPEAQITGTGLEGNLQELLPRRERMSDDELGNLLAAVGNHEAKALLLASMTHGRIYPGAALHKLLINGQGSTRVWSLDRTLAFNYCSYTLAPIGLVSKEIINPDMSVYGYEKTKYGADIGDALVGHLLSFSEDHPQASLIDIFGSTSSPGNTKEIETSQGERIEVKKRAPLTRYQILFQLATLSLPLREADLINELGEEQSIIETHLTNLDERGIINYQGLRRNEDYAYYKFSPDRPDQPPPPSRKQPHNTQQIYGYIEQHPDRPITSEVVRAAIFPDREVSDKNHKGEISRILSHLHKQGYLTREGMRNHKQSDINLTEEQRDLLVDMITILDRFTLLDPVFLEEGRQLARTIVADTKRFSKLLLKARESSANAKNQTRAEHFEDIASILSKYSECTSQQIYIYLKDECGIRLNRRTVGELMRMFKQQQQLVVVKKGSEYYYSLPK